MAEGRGPGGTGLFGAELVDTDLFETVLVANRGEIAVRIIRTLRELGVRSVAVFSKADDGAPHVLAADVAVRIGPAEATGSYLNVAAIVAAAAATGAQAVHPGYGFLSESPVLAQACADAGLVFIGPPPEALAAMGDKIRAKELARVAGVPVIDGVAEQCGARAASASGSLATHPVAGPDHRDADLIQACEPLGFPMLVKPSAGGGGKGMYRAEDAAELSEAIASARRVAAAAFTDDTLLVERFVPTPRHIEVQVLADAAGHVLAVGERDCSLQRRHQKVIEEAPATVLDETTRARLAEAACAVTASVAYTGAGTVEFLVSAQDASRFFFLEMNTRLQVEHPVTEEVHGLDLVAWQVRIAAGADLPTTHEGLTAAGLAPAGHAVEARIYAERPDAGFLPATGTAELVRWPAGVRVDAGIATGSVITTHYDPMLAKVIATGFSRTEALRRLDAALADTVILGVHTNLDYLRRVLATQQVRDGTAETTFLDALAAERSDGSGAACRHTLSAQSSGDDAPPAPPEQAVIAAALLRHVARWTHRLWDQPSGWRLGATEPPVYGFETAIGQARVAIDGPPAAATARLLPEHPLREVSLTPRPGSAVGHLLRIDDLTVTVHASESDDGVWLHVLGHTHHLTTAWAATSNDRAAGRTGDGQVRSPMPGTVVAVRVPAGTVVAGGDVLLTVEAMKMEYQVRAPIPGRIEGQASVGDHVSAEQVLATIHPEDPQDQG